jgi:hypothetical protein
MMGSLILRPALGAAMLIGGTTALAQVTVTPESLRVVVTRGQAATAGVTLVNGGTVPAHFCIDFDRPLQRTAGAHILGAGCGAPGELLDTFDSFDLGRSWLPYGVTMTPDGRLFVAEWAGGIRETYELTGDLTFIRRFPHPVVGELAPNPTTTGVTYRPEAGTLWWTNAEDSGSTLHRVLLLEGTLDGVATGRRIPLPIPATGPPPTDSGYPAGASYDPASGRFYYADIQNDSLWAIDTTGAVPDGYPVALAAYPGVHYIGNVVDAFGGADGGIAGVRLELAVGFDFSNIFDRVAVTDTEGSDLGYDEAPLNEVIALNNGTAGVLGSARSRLDPNGVLYVTYWTPGPDGVAAVRPVPLAPSWLSVSQWMGEIPAGGSAEVSLTFSAGQREPGEYHSTLVVEDTAGVVLASVPLTLVVEAGTPAEPGPEEAGVALTVSPNPVAGAGTVTVTVARPAAHVCVTVHDVLGRVVETRHVASLPPGTTRLPLDAAGLPAGVYLVRAIVEGSVMVHRFSVVR